MARNWPRRMQGPDIAQLKGRGLPPSTSGSRLKACLVRTADMLESACAMLQYTISWPCLSMCYLPEGGQKKAEARKVCVKPLDFDDRTSSPTMVS